MREANWERNFRSAARYARKYKHLLVPASYVDSDGVRLGVWISNLRAARKTARIPIRSRPPHQKAEQHWHGVGCPGCQVGNRLSAGQSYYKAHGNLHAAANYKSDETGFCWATGSAGCGSGIPPTTPSSPLSAAQSLE